MFVLIEYIESFQTFNVSCLHNLQALHYDANTVFTLSAITNVVSNRMISSLNAFSDLLCSKHIIGGCEVPRSY